jgi:hypothetical protein
MMTTLIPAIIPTKKPDLSKTEENLSPHLETLVSDLKEKSAPENFELQTLVVASASALAAITTLAIVFGLGTIGCLWFKKQPPLGVRGMTPVV